MSRVLPILFNTDMVRAILDGRKTVTRRIVKPQLPDKCSHCIALGEKSHGDYIYDAIAKNVYCRECGYPLYHEDRTYTAPYHPGDVLYVRETWAFEPCWDCGLDTEEQNQCDECANRVYNTNRKEHGCYLYRASCADNEYPTADIWHPSIHMPKQATRIWLRVTDVRVERLQDIRYMNCIHEGIPYKQIERNVISDFSKAWDSTIKKSDLDRYGWTANPWVWVIEFEKCKKRGDGKCLN